MDDSDQPCFDEKVHTWLSRDSCYKTHITQMYAVHNYSNLQRSCLALKDDNDISTNENLETDINKPSKVKPVMTLDIASAQVEQLRILPVVSPTSIDINEYGFPLAIFTKVSDD